MRRLPAGIFALFLMAPAWSVADSGEDPSDPLEAGSCVERAIDAIQSRYDGVADLRADFEQVTRSAVLPGSGASVSGTVSFAKPGKMRWTYTDPPSLLVSDGETLWIYDPAFKEVQKLSAGSQYLSGASIQFLLGGGNIRRDFTIVERSCSADSIEIDLTPLQPATYERLGIIADPSSGDLRRTTIYDLVGNVTEVTFSNLETDLNPAPETFRFDPPAGVKVMELGGNPE